MPEREIRQSTPLEADPLVAFGALMVLALIVLVIVACVQGQDYQRREMEFMSKCIEFHSADRCGEFFKYRRQDLGVQK